MILIINYPYDIKPYDINNKLSYRSRQDLSTYKPLELELTFIEIINMNKRISSFIVYIDI